jgi:hypothetical protein
MRFLLALIFCAALCKAQDDPAVIRDVALPVVHCFRNAKIDLIILGTIGVAHARNPNFSWVYLDSLLARTSPDVLLVQIRPEHFEKQEYFDGAPEMAYLAYRARKMWIDCRPYDWWLDMQLVKWDIVSAQKRMGKIYDNIKNAFLSTGGQMIMIAIDVSLVEALQDSLVQGGFKEWSCPQAQFEIKKYPDLPDTMIEIFKNGTIYLASNPNAASELVQQKINDLSEIITHRGYLFKR